MKNKALLLLLALLTLAGCSRTPCEDLTEDQLSERKDCAITVPVYPNEGYYDGGNSTIHNNSYYYYQNPLFQSSPIPGSNGTVSSPAPTQRSQTHRLRRQTAVEQQKRTNTQPKKSAPTQSNQAAPPPPPPTQSNRQRVTPSSNVSPTQPSRSTGRVGGSNFSSPRPSSSSRPPSSSRPARSSRTR